MKKTDYIEKAINNLENRSAKEHKSFFLGITDYKFNFLGWLDKESQLTYDLSSIQLFFTESEAINAYEQADDNVRLDHVYILHKV